MQFNLATQKKSISLWRQLNRHELLKRVMNAIDMKVLVKHNIEINPILDRYLVQPQLQLRIAESNRRLALLGLPKSFEPA